jgi:RNA polymerase sigma-70 factor (ECF subfamily)
MLAMPAGEPENPAQQDDQLEQALVERARAGDAGAWRTLLSRHQDRLYAVCVRMAGGTGRRDPGGADPADLCQEAMVKIVQGLGGFDGASKISTWMTRIAMNVCLSHLRATKVRQHASLDAPAPGGARNAAGGGSGGGGAGGAGSGWGAGLAGGELGPAQSVQEKEMRDRLARALARLDAEARAIVVLRDVRGLDYDQIAAVLGVAVGTVKSRLFRARAALRAEMEPGGGSDGARPEDRRSEDR